MCHSKLQSAVVNSELFDLFDLRYVHGVNVSGSISSVITRNALLRNRVFEQLLVFTFCAGYGDSLTAPQAARGDGTCLHVRIDSMQLHMKAS